MATQKSVATYIAAQLAGLGDDLVVKPMFGEYGIWLEGKVVALIADDLLFLKPTDPGRELTVGYDEAPPYPGAKPSIIIPKERIADSDWLVGLLQTTADALPAPKLKRPKLK